MSKSLSKDEIYCILAGTHKDQDPKILKEISYNLALASTTQGSLDERARRALSRINAAPQAASPLVEQVRSQQQQKKCPICKSAMEIVKLLEGRPAHFCPSHNVTEPLPVESGRE
jgi:hypothetical protein